MESFLIIATERWDRKGYPVSEILGENRAINEAMRIFREGTMYKVIVVNEALSIIFKDTRRCRCTNVQVEMVVEEIGMGREKCMDCKLVLNHRGHWRLCPEDFIEAEVSEDAAEIGLAPLVAAGSVASLNTGQSLAERDGGLEATAHGAERVEETR